METEIKNNNKNFEKEFKVEINNINRIILDILCSEAIKKIKFILHVLKELLKKKTNILSVYLTNDIDHLSTEKQQKQIFNSLQKQIELCENENDYNIIKKKIEDYIDTLSQTNKLLCQNSPVDRNLKENRDKIIEDGSMLLKIFRQIKKLNFSAVLSELNKFKEENSLLMNLKQNVYHKKQIINILNEQIKEQIENTENKKKIIEDKIKEIEKKKKIFFIKFMIYYIYKEEYVHANITNYELTSNYKYDSVKNAKEKMEEELKSYNSINDYIKLFLNKRNDRLQSMYDTLLDYYEKEKFQKNQNLGAIKKKLNSFVKEIEEKRKIIANYEEDNKLREEQEKENIKKEIEEKDYLKKKNEYIMFLQNVGRNKINIYNEKMRKKKKSQQKKIKKRF
ncbi:conserved protein, unknown function [Hepatocystis sp. ex Piliocolobus tephrosceles]|nr:conserved protein, unknown function [Hepatocystis sp. ex Piliocolobus tephrosceles]